MRKSKFDNRIPKYFHSDGNGIHLQVGEKYKISLDNRIINIYVISEFKHFYLVKVEDKYQTTINKYQENLHYL
ncbi:hypothetical protein [uncultured Helcococcus sp.]|uniref:hypothetical protein n=1 Tax=uncultured Helcococcus sp. TaxID=1072508 RepID=UPI002633A6E1|nr:hypothetical protein [uncultured Helcococcus sp.]